jgi:hypothetical protein
MSSSSTPETSWNPWKWITIGMATVFATALITGVVVAHYVSSSSPPPPGAQLAGVPPGAAEPQAAQPQAPQAVQPPAAPPARAEADNGSAPRHHVRARPSSADIEECNRYASASHDATGETVKDALLGAAAGAGLGAAGGAIAGGGSGAGKGAGIGGLVGAAAGTVYGLNESNKRDARASAAYRTCMRRRGYTD